MAAATSSSSLPKQLLRWFLRLIGPALLVAFLMTSHPEKLASILLAADPWMIFWAILLMGPFILIKTWRWLYILRELGQPPIPYWTAAGLYCVGIFLGSVTPGQSGDLVKAWYLKDHGHQLAPSLLSVVLDRLLDLILMAAFAVMGIFALGGLLPDRSIQTVLVILMGIGLTLVTIIIMARKPRQWFLTQVLPRVLPKRFAASLERLSAQLHSLSLRPRTLIMLTIASLGSAVFTFGRIWLLFLALHIYIPAPVLIGGTALTAVLQILPISIGGVGVRDAVLIAILLPYSYSKEQALSVSALFLLLTVEHIVVGWLISLRFPLDRLMREARENEGAEDSVADLAPSLSSDGAVSTTSISEGSTHE